MEVEKKELHTYLLIAFQKIKPFYFFELKKRIGNSKETMARDT